MSKQSAGILLYRRTNKILEVLLVHPGGPFFAKKDLGSWSIPKGELQQGEEPVAAAKREFFEETGRKITGEFLSLTSVQQKSGKVVFAWAVESDFDPTALVSNNFTIEWPPKSGVRREYPEIDKAAWFGVETAKQKINTAQISFIDELVSKFGITR
jgi:predicted NUDIX family NTP pyrophosphohydrolase